MRRVVESRFLDRSTLYRVIIRPQVVPGREHFCYGSYVCHLYHGAIALGCSYDDDLHQLERYGTWSWVTLILYSY